MMMGNPMMPQQNQMNNDYNPDQFEYDDELAEGEIGERIILSDDPIPRELGVIKTIGTRKVNAEGYDDQNPDQFCEWEDDDEDDARINEFLSSQNRPSQSYKPRVCMFYQTNSCKNGASCQFAHEMSEENSAAKSSYNREDDAECQICLTYVLASGRQFGVLDSCNHIFCLKCIRSWRATYDKRTTKHHFRTCPICRQTSYLVIPSFFHATGSAKEVLCQEYSGALHDIPCRLFNKGRGECPFKDSCMYAHIDKAGNEFEYGYADDKAINSEGQWVDDHEPTLAERMGVI